MDAQSNGQADEVLEDFDRKAVQVRNTKTKEVETFYLTDPPPSKFRPFLRRLTELEGATGGAASDVVEKMAALQDDLLAMCLTREDGSPVDLAAADWGVRLRKKLFDQCMSHVGVGGGSAEREGKGSGGAAGSTGGTASPSTSAIGA